MGILEDRHHSPALSPTAIASRPLDSTDWPRFPSRCLRRGHETRIVSQLGQCSGCGVDVREQWDASVDSISCISWTLRYSDPERQDRHVANTGLPFTRADPDSARKVASAAIRSGAASYIQSAWPGPPSENRLKGLLVDIERAATGCPKDSKGNTLRDGPCW